MALWELLLLLLVAGLLVRVLVQPKVSPAEQRLRLAVAELGRQGQAQPHLREPLRQVQAYGRDLARLLPQMAEVGRFLQKPGLEGPTRDRLLARHNELTRILERGTEYLETLGAEMVLLEGSGEPPALSQFPLFLIELREVLHPATPHRG